MSDVHVSHHSRVVDEQLINSFLLGCVIDHFDTNLAAVQTLISRSSLGFCIFLPC
jgi:hypothetical protein